MESDLRHYILFMMLLSLIAKNNIKLMDGNIHNEWLRLFLISPFNHKNGCAPKIPKPGTLFTGIWMCCCLSGDTEMPPQPQSCTSPGLLIGYDVSVLLSCSLINNDHDTSAQWAVKSLISTDQRGHGAPEIRGLLVWVWNWEENVVVNTARM